VRLVCVETDTRTDMARSRQTICLSRIYVLYGVWNASFYLLHTSWSRIYTYTLWGRSWSRIYTLWVRKSIYFMGSETFLLPATYFFYSSCYILSDIYGVGNVSFRGRKRFFLWGRKRFLLIGSETLPSNWYIFSD